ncbi:hypothetical protein SAMN02787100_4866 [Chryseobacterium sp. OV279]|nr:hypothetical protein SAMN02787100_4866 [Chryseobacterium sp. OV279]
MKIKVFSAVVGSGISQSLVRMFPIIHKINFRHLKQREIIYSRIQDNLDLFYNKGQIPNTGKPVIKIIDLTVSAILNGKSIST